MVLSSVISPVQSGMQTPKSITKVVPNMKKSQLSKKKNVIRLLSMVQRQWSPILKSLCFGHTFVYLNHYRFISLNISSTDPRLDSSGNRPLNIHRLHYNNILFSHQHTSLYINSNISLFWWLWLLSFGIFIGARHDFYMYIYLNI